MPVRRKLALPLVLDLATCVTALALAQTPAPPATQPPPAQPPSDITLVLQGNQRPLLRLAFPALDARGVSGAAIAGLDNPDFTYGYYIDQMLSQIRANWVRPPLGGGIEAVVHFRVLRDGRIDDLRIVTSSGYSSFDLAGLRAVQSASPLPPLPASYRRGELGVNLVIR